MNLLVLSPWFPCPPDNGSRLRAFHLLREWANAGHSIRLVTGLQDDIVKRADLETLQKFCESVTVVPWRWHDGKTPISLQNLLSRVPRSIAETKNVALRDAMIQEFAQTPDACIAMELASAPFIPTNTNGVPVILEQVEVSGVSRAVDEARSAQAKLQATLTRVKHDNYWRSELKRFDAITAVSEEEASAIRSLIGNEKPTVTVAPNGVDTKYYSLVNAAPVAGRIIYNGSLNYGPNREAVSWFVENMLPLIAKRTLDVHLVITGAFPVDAQEQFATNPRVHLTGFVPDIRTVLATAMICAVPLRTGGGTRLKILEAWAAGVPVVSTEIGAVGLAGSENGSHLLLADTPEMFAQACTKLLMLPDLRQQIEKNARRLVEERYNWKGIAKQITGLLKFPENVR